MWLTSWQVQLEVDLDLRVHLDSVGSGSVVEERDDVCGDLETMGENSDEGG